MRKPGTYVSLETLGRERLSKHFHMREFLYSEIGNFYGKPNIPDNPDLALAAGRAICTELLDPIVDTFGPIAVRSSYRSPDLNHFGATQVKPQKCAANPKNYAGHIWDRRDANGNMGACACISIPWFSDQYDQGRDWRDLAWWIHDHLPYSSMWFFPKRAALNLTWNEEPERAIDGYMPRRIQLLKKGEDPAEPAAMRAERYVDFPTLGAIVFPPVPNWSAR